MSVICQTDHKTAQKQESADKRRKKEQKQNRFDEYDDALFK